MMAAHPGVPSLQGAVLVGKVANHAAIFAVDFGPLEMHIAKIATSESGGPMRHTKKAPPYTYMIDTLGCRSTAGPKCL
jgi:hypothetical protein